MAPGGTKRALARWGATEQAHWSWVARVGDLVQAPLVMLAPAVRKLLLVVHVTLSVGWIGAALAYMALDFRAATSETSEILRAAYSGMAMIAGNVIVPLAFGALLTGISISLGTKWGLFRHYWVVMSLALTTVATLVLLVEMQTINHFAHIAADPATSNTELRELGGTLPHSIGGTVVLLIVLTLNMYKPRGVTRHGWRKEHERRGDQAAGAS